MNNRLVTEDEANEVLRMMRNAGLTEEKFRGSIDEIGDFFYKLALAQTVDYPPWIKKHETPELANVEFMAPRKTEILFPGDHQINENLESHQVYQYLAVHDYIKRTLSYVHLKWYLANRYDIPEMFFGKRIPAWSSVVRSHNQKMYLPYLWFQKDQSPDIAWYDMEGKWSLKDTLFVLAYI